MSYASSKSRVPGLLLVLLLAILANELAGLPAMQSAGLSALTLAIVSGMLLGNTVYSPLSRRCHDGVMLAKQRILRLGIILFGFRLTLHDIQAVGAAGIVIDVLMVSSVFLLACGLGVHVFKLDKDSVILIGAGSSICGAAAVLATEPVVKAGAERVSVAVATVVVFGTLSMFLYPLLYGPLSALAGMTPAQYGLYTGSTVHEVAQVVVAGRGVSEAAADTAVITKMIRVMMLAPFLMALSWWLARGAVAAGQSGRKIVIPWFAVGFLLVAGLNSLALIPAAWVAKIVWLDNLLLAMAMAALGLTTQFSAIREAGLRPLLLAFCLFLYLVIGGALLNLLVGYWLT